MNSEGRIEYYHSVDTDSLDYPTLWDNAIHFLSGLSVPDQPEKEVRTDVTLTELTHTFGFYLMAKPALTKQVDGVMIADITMIINDSRYEYSINNFRFIKYARDRFGKFSSKSSKKYALEKYYPENQTKIWIAHYATINGKIEQLASNMGVNMMELRKSE